MNCLASIQALITFPARDFFTLLENLVIRASSDSTSLRKVEQ